MLRYEQKKILCVVSSWAVAGCRRPLMKITFSRASMRRQDSWGACLTSTNICEGVTRPQQRLSVAAVYILSASLFLCLTSILPHFLIFFGGTLLPPFIRGPVLLRIRVRFRSLRRRDQ